MISSHWCSPGPLWFRGSFGLELQVPFCSNSETNNAWVFGREAYWEWLKTINTLWGKWFSLKYVPCWTAVIIRFSSTMRHITRLVKVSFKIITWYLANVYSSSPIASRLLQRLHFHFFMSVLHKIVGLPSTMGALLEKCSQPVQKIQQ